LLTNATTNLRRRLLSAPTTGQAGRRDAEKRVSQKPVRNSFDHLVGAGEQLPKRTLSEFAVVP
jgi:hypothetical protein